MVWWGTLYHRPRSQSRFPFHTGRSSRFLTSRPSFQSLRRNLIAPTQKLKAPTRTDSRPSYQPDPMSESEPKTAGAKTQCTADALPGSAALVDKERLLSLRELYNWDGPGKWAYTMREECVVVRLDVETPAAGGGEDNGSERGHTKGKGKERKECVATFELDLKACESRPHSPHRKYFSIPI